jgi:hypothetical protein
MTRSSDFLLTVTRPRSSTCGHWNQVQGRIVMKENGSDVLHGSCRGTVSVAQAEAADRGLGRHVQVRSRTTLDATTSNPNPPKTSNRLSYKLCKYPVRLIHSVLVRSLGWSGLYRRPVQLTVSGAIHCILLICLGSLFFLAYRLSMLAPGIDHEC